MKKLISEIFQLWVIESVLVRLIHSIFRSNLNFEQTVERGKDKILICGSGWSINNITEDQLQRINNEFSVMSFNEFYKCNLMRIDYYIIREFELKFLGKFQSRFHSIFNFHEIKRVSKEINSNKKMKNTFYFILKDWKSGSALLWDLFNKPQKRKYFSNTFIRGKNLLPSHEYSSISHCNSTLFDCINISYLMGYKKIYLAGIDLNDRRYFYLNYDETRDFDIKKGSNFNDQHATAIDTKKNIILWRDFFARQGIEIKLTNKNSYLADVLPFEQL
jgi:hypothetical protein